MGPDQNERDSSERRAIVTGGASGLGAEMGTALVAAGYQVGIMDLDRAQAEAFCSRLGNAVPLVANVSDNVAVEAAFAEFGEAPDLLINNAGIVRVGPLHEQSVADYCQRTVTFRDNQCPSNI
jgi:3-oxoacyl-[acyl-carrier protein] reductase